MSEMSIAVCSFRGRKAWNPGTVRESTWPNAGTAGTLSKRRTEWVPKNAKKESIQTEDENHEGSLT